jgi:autotransporter-like protein
MLSAAAVALLSGPALAVGPTDQSTVSTTNLKTSETGDLTIDSTGGINFKSATIPDLTVDSSNNVNNGGVITASNQDSATAIAIDANGLSGPGGLPGTILTNGTIDLTGTGTTKKAIYLTGASSYTGTITLGDSSVVNIVGDKSIGITTDSNTTLNGDWVLGGSLSVAPTTASSTSASQIFIADFLGTTNGDIRIQSGATYSATGDGTQGIVIAGPVNACNTAVVNSCTEIGTFSNSGTITVAGITTRSSTGVNPESGSALEIENSIAGGILNNGPSVAGDSTAAAVISSNGFVNSSGTATPTVVISPAATVFSTMTIGQVTGDANGSFSFINRGTIAAAPEDSNFSTQAMLINGGSNANVKFTGGLFNSGSILATATSVTPGSPVTATALQIGTFVNIPLIEISSQNASSPGTIRAIVAGPQGGTAAALIITGAPITNSNNTQTITTKVPTIQIDAGASITANASASVTTGTAVPTVLTAIAIGDNSNFLTTLTNNGTISATTSLTDATTGATLKLSNGADPTEQAVNTQKNSVGLNFTNNGTVLGDVLFGAGSDTYTIKGTSQTAMAQDTGRIDFGSSLGGAGTDRLIVGQFSNVAGQITAEGNLAVQVQGTGVLSVQNIVQASATASNALTVTTLDVAGGSPTTAGTINLTVSQNQGTNAVVIASQAVNFGSGALLNVQYGSLLSTITGTTQTFNLISAPTGNLNIADADVARYNTAVGGTLSGNGTLPFLFNSASIQKVTNVGGLDVLQLTVSAKTVDQLGLTGYARTIFPFANTAIAQDQTLGAAMIAGINSATNDPKQGPRQAQAAYDAFAPDVSGGSRAIAISLTDQATGPVAARLRDLRMFAKEPGELTLWGNEFGEYLSTHGQSVHGVAGSNSPSSCASPCPAIDLSGFKDHGFGFAVGLDEGSPAGGWYGAAFTFYTGDVSELGDRDSKTTTLWYMLTGYSTWRGRGLFMDAQFNVGYADFKGKRILDLTIPSATSFSTFSREADSKRAGLVGSIGVTLGAQMKYGPFVNIPQLSIDGMSMREEGYTEQNGGNGFDLTVNPYYASSLRAFLGDEVRTSINLGDFFIQPSARAGYRFDFLNDPVKLRAAFANVSLNGTGSQVGDTFTIQGPDPSRGNFVVGGALNATTDNWTIGLNYDFVRGTNNATQQIGTISLLGRI